MIDLPTAKPPKGAEKELKTRLAEVAAEYAGEEREAAELEVSEGEDTDRGSLVFSVRLSPEVYDAVKTVAQREHLTPSALIRQWVSERVANDHTEGDLTDAVAALRREVERVARFTRTS